MQVTRNRRMEDVVNSVPAQRVPFVSGATLCLLLTLLMGVGAPAQGDPKRVLLLYDEDTRLPGLSILDLREPPGRTRQRAHEYQRQWCGIRFKPHQPELVSSA
jgi:hypothetical protein